MPGTAGAKRGTRCGARRAFAACEELREAEGWWSEASSEAFGIRVRVPRERGAVGDYRQCVSRVVCVDGCPGVDYEASLVVGVRCGVGRDSRRRHVASRLRCS